MILVDGVERAGLPADDRGLAYGDGAFETLRIERGAAPWLEAHLERLGATCAELGIVAPLAELRRDAARLVDGVDRGILKLIVTRGSGGRGYAASGAAVARRVASRHAWPEHPASNWQQGVKVRWCATRVAARAPLGGRKHLNRLAQVMARREWADATIAEGLLLDDAGAVAEGTATNLFMVRDAALITPAIEGGAVAGLARAALLERAGGLGLRPEVRRVEPAELEAANELLLCNAVVGVWPVRELAGRVLAVGAATRRLQGALAAEGIGP